MKTGLLLVSVLVVVAFTLPFRSTKIQAAVVADASPSASFSFLRTHKQGKGVVANWETNKADIVLDFIVQRTYEEPTSAYVYWENIATMSSSSGRSFTYTDKEVFPGTIYYRVVALQLDGRTVHSQTASVTVEDR